MKLAAQTAGGGLEQAGSPPHGAPFTMLAHVGPGVAEGEKRVKTAGTQPARLARLHPQGEARWQGAQRIDHQAAFL
jgi:hypothetical protein